MRPKLIFQAFALLSVRTPLKGQMFTLRCWLHLIHSDRCYNTLFYTQTFLATFTSQPRQFPWDLQLYPGSAFAFKGSIPQLRCELVHGTAASEQTVNTHTHTHTLHSQGSILCSVQYSEIVIMYTCLVQQLCAVMGVCACCVCVFRVSFRVRWGRTRTSPSLGPLFRPPSWRRAYCCTGPTGSWNTWRWEAPGRPSASPQRRTPSSVPESESAPSCRSRSWQRGSGCCTWWTGSLTPHLCSDGVSRWRPSMLPGQGSHGHMALLFGCMCRGRNPVARNDIFPLHSNNMGSMHGSVAYRTWRGQYCKLHVRWRECHSQSCNREGHMWWDHDHVT